MLRGIGSLLAPFSEVPRSSGLDSKGIPKISNYCGVVRVVRIDGKTPAAEEGGVASFRVVNERREEAISAQPSHNSFVKPLSDLYPRLPCRICKGLGEVVCNVCDGQGTFNKGGYHKKNPISVERILAYLVMESLRHDAIVDGLATDDSSCGSIPSVKSSSINLVDKKASAGSKWTAMVPFFGWRYFQVQSKRRGSGRDWFVELVATCDNAARFWVNVQNLKDRERWSMGWLQKVEILEAQNKDTASNLVCKACKGKGQQPCTCTYRDPNEPFLDIIEV